MPLFTVNFPDEDPLFCVSFHPEKPQFVVGLATGRVTFYDYTSEVDSPVPTQLWTTKRHKGSCRAIAFTQSGDFVVSCGSDGVVKKFHSQTGKVVAKNKIVAGASTICINEEYVVVGDDDGTVHIFKLSDLSLHRKYDLPEIDSVTAVCALSGVNKHNFAVAADMHIFRIDVRKDEVVSKSEDQEDEILSGCITSETRSAWGMSEGVVTIWKNKGLGDQQQRVKLTKDGSIDSMLAGEVDDHALAGTSDGWVTEIDVVAAQVLYKARHNPDVVDDDVSYLDYDFEYHLVSGSMSLLKVWDTDELAEVDRKEKELAKAQVSGKRTNDTDIKRAKGKKSKKNSPSTANKDTSAFADLMG